MIQDRLSQPHLGLYIHIPFCHGKCAYCAFYSVSNRQEMIDRYLICLCHEMNARSVMLNNRVVDTVYIGGGTPSLLNSKQIFSLFDHLYKNFCISKTVEISIETNPESIDMDKLKTYKSVGVNRISIGLQAWQDHILKSMNRPHNIKEFLSAFELCKNTGFDNINIDTIFGYPGQTIEDWNDTLTNVINLNPTHLSCYSLETDNRSLLAVQLKQNKTAAVSENVDRQMYKLSQNMLKSNGYNQYELSNYSQDGYMCQHNFNFWNHNDYLGLGAAAHSFINNIHSHHEENLGEYIKNPIKQIFDSSLNHKESQIEWLMLHLRLTSGFETKLYSDKFNTHFETDFSDQIQNLIDNNLLTNKDNFYRLTSKGQDLYNQVISIISE